MMDKLTAYPPNPVQFLLINSSFERDMYARIKLRATAPNYDALYLDVDCAVETTSASQAHSPGDVRRQHRSLGR